LNTVLHAGIRQKQTLMRHLLPTFDTSLQREPPTLHGMGTPQIPVGVGEHFPIDFRVIAHVERIDSTIMSKIIR
jgi:hypothetical protein